MGESGPLPSDEATGHRTKAELDMRAAYIRPAAIDTGPPDARWSLVTVQRWYEYWSSYVAKVVEVVDLPAVRRLFDMIDRQERLWEIIDDEGYVVSTEKSGDKAHPLLAVIDQLDKRIDRLESQFGVRPLARARLGLKTAAAMAAQDKVVRTANQRGRVINNGAPEQAAE